MPRFAPVVVLLLSWSLTTPRLFAQSDNAAATQELRQQVNELQKQLKDVQAKLAELETQKAPSASTEPRDKTSPQAAGTTQAGQPPIQGPTSPQVGEGTATYDTFS